MVGPELGWFSLGYYKRSVVIALINEHDMDNMYSQYAESQQCNHTNVEYMDITEDLLYMQPRDKPIKASSLHRFHISLQL